MRRQGAQWERSIPQVSAEQAQERTVGEGPVGRTAAEVRRPQQAAAGTCERLPMNPAEELVLHPAGPGESRGVFLIWADLAIIPETEAVAWSQIKMKPPKEETIR